nr:SIS domain-containing protein [Caulobacter sp. NIBR2454]
MFAEAAEAASAVKRQLAANAQPVAALGEKLRAMKPRAVVTCARGSSDHAATFAKYLFETRVGLITSSAALSTASVYAARSDLEGVLYLAISQSGRSPDLLASVEAAKTGGAFVVALVNDAASPLAALADAYLPLHAGPEISVAATKSYICTLSAIAHLTAEWTKDAELSAALQTLPALLDRAWTQDWSEAVDRLRPASNLYVVARGLGFAAAQEAALKFKETCGLHAEAFSAAEVMHGPLALVQPGFPVLAFSQDDETRPSVLALAEDLKARGAQLLFADVDATGPGALPAIAAHPVLQPALAIQSFYRMAAALSVARGYDPDQPPHLRKVTETV